MEFNIVPGERKQKGKIHLRSSGDDTYCSCFISKKNLRISSNRNEVTCLRCLELSKGIWRIYLKSGVVG